MEKTIYLFILIILLSGCVSDRSIYMNAATINYSDGINEKEAKYIAQKYCLDNGIRDVFVSSPEIQETFSSVPAWEVRFETKNLLETDYYTVIVDKETGKVTFGGYER